MIVLDQIMEPYMYDAICRMVKANMCDEEILTVDEKLEWNKQLPQFSIREDGGLQWRGRKVPTMEQLETTIQPIH